MALFKSHIASEISGSVAGTTFSRNRGGAYMRARVVPTNPNSPEQQAIRNAVNQLANQWTNVLSASVREAWELYAANVPILNPLGAPIYVSGMNHYIRSLAPRMAAGLTYVQDAPTIFTTGEFTDPSFAASDATQKVALAFENTDAWAAEAGAHMLLYVSRPKGPGINFCKGPYRYAGKVSGAVVPPTSPAQIDAPFAFAADQRLFCRVTVSRADMRLSMPFRGFCTAAV